ncbi:TNFAIP3-interacting protein 3 [Ctenodactylus gundi]
MNKKEKQEKLLMFTNQSEDSERCESMELDNEIRDLIERNTSDLKGVTLQLPTSHTYPCSPKCPQSSRRRNLIHPLERKIRCLEKQREELLQVNQQWDQQFAAMKELYERKVAELKMKLAAAERVLSTLQRGPPPQDHSAGAGQEAPTRDQPPQEERENLNEELQELKKENKRLKEKNALANKKKEHYECEIIRLNKALEDALKIESSSFSGDCSGKSKVEHSHAEMITELEVLKQQVQIYEEDFKKERSDRERLNQEKEELQQINQTTQYQLNRLSSQIKACQMEKEKLEKQLKQMYFPTCDCGLSFHQLHRWDRTGPGAVQSQQEHSPDYQWYALDQLPPDVHHKANARCEHMASIFSVTRLALTMSQVNGGNYARASMPKIPHGNRPVHLASVVEPDMAVLEPLLKECQMTVASGVPPAAANRPPSSVSSPLPASSVPCTQALVKLEKWQRDRPR